MLKYREKSYLVKEYVKKERTSYEIAEDCGVDPSTIQRWLKKNNIESRPDNQEKRVRLRLNHSGYPVFIDNTGGEQKRIFIHQLQAIIKFGFEEVCDKEVHHKNGIKWDNRLENIELMEPGEHQRHHAKERWSKDSRLAEWGR